MIDEQLTALARELQGSVTDEGIALSTELVSGEMPMVKVTVRDREEFPIYLTLDEEQILCTTYLWRENEIDPDKRVDLLEAMLTMNLPMPLSSFGKVGGQYLIFGAMAVGSRLGDVTHEIATLSDNTLNAVEAMIPFLA